MKELNLEVKQALLAPFQSAEVRVRTHPYVAAYVTARVVMTRLDEVIPWQWSFKLVGNGTVDSNGVMHQDGVLVVMGPEGLALEYHDRGSAPPDAARGQAKQAKHAVSDCFKRCAVHLGVGRYLYELQGVQGGRIPKPSLEKALAAVGYQGAWDDRHHGTIGGIREADLEDEPDGAQPPVDEPVRGGASGRGGSRSKPAAAPIENGSANGANGHASARSHSGSVRLSDEDRARLAAAVERGGGNSQAPAFLGWLQKHTANHAQSLDEVLSEDLDELIRTLDELAARRKS